MTGAAGSKSGSRSRPPGAAGRWAVVVGVPVAVLAVTWRQTGLGWVEVVAGSGVLVGLVIAFGIRRATAPRAAQPRVDSQLAARTDEVLKRLDPLEHRRVDLGRPWPRLVVGPSGVSVVDVCPVFDLDAAAAVVREVLAEHGRDREVPVRALRVTDRDVPPPAPRVGVGIVAVDDLGHELVRGPVLPMRTVDGVFHLLTRHSLVALDTD